MTVPVQLGTPRFVSGACVRRYTVGRCTVEEWSKAYDDVGRCKLDPGLKAHPGFKV